MLSVVRNFVITFLVSAIIFGLIAYGISTFVVSSLGLGGDGEENLESQSMAIETTPSSPVTGGEDTKPDDNPDVLQGNSFNVLLIGTDYQPDMFNDYDLSLQNEGREGFPMIERPVGADMIILLRIDKEYKKFIFCSIPSETKVSVDGVTTKLGDVYDEMGIDYFSQQITALTSLPIDYYAVISVDGMKNIVDELGGLTYYVTQDMKYFDPTQNLDIDLKKGTQKLDGEKAMMLLRYNGYSDNGTTRRNVALSFMKVFFNRFLTPEYLPQASEYWEKFLSYVETDFTEEDFTEKLELIFSYSEFIAEDITYPGSGTLIDGDRYFEPNISKAYSTFGLYK